MGVTFSLAVLLEGRIVLLPLVLTAVGSGAFHPAATMEATARGRLHFAGRAAFAASLFFLFGQIGLSVGPAIGGLIIDGLNVKGLALLLILVLPIGSYAGLRIPGKRTEAGERSERPIGQANWRRFVPFATLIALRSWSQMTMIAFLPKYYTDLGFRPATLGVIAALFMGGSAFGGLVGGWLGDRVDKRRLIASGLILAGVPLALMPEFGPTPWAYLLVPLAGALSGSSHSLIVVLAQGMLPGSVGAASGAVLGFTFASGSIGALVSGFLADGVGFGAVFLTSAVTVVLAGLLAAATRGWNDEN
jgi:FSR family fosmidomycin resistance protein-like MFS transporter